jgi:hypothetical protein
MEKSPTTTLMGVELYSLTMVTIWKANSFMDAVRAMVDISNQTAVIMKVI